MSGRGRSVYGAISLIWPSGLPLPCSCGSARAEPLPLPCLPRNLLSDGVSCKLPSALSTTNGSKIHLVKDLDRRCSRHYSKGLLKGFPVLAAASNAVKIWGIEGTFGPLGEGLLDECRESAPDPSSSRVRVYLDFPIQCQFI